MTSQSAVSSTPALVEDIRLWEKDETRRIRRILAAAAVFYLGLQAAGNYRVIEGLLNQFLQPNDPAALTQNNSITQDWQFGAQIDHADATTIAVGLAAVVLTINIAVFAARLGAPKDLRGDMFLARWQSSMEKVAPLAASGSVSFALTRVPNELSLGLGLLLVSGIAVVASNVRVAGRLSAIAMQVRAAEILSDQAAGQLRRLLLSLPLTARHAKRPKLWLPGPRGYKLYVAGAIVLVMLIEVSMQIMLLVINDMETARTMNSWQYLRLYLGLLLVGAVTTAPALYGLVALAVRELKYRTTQRPQPSSPWLTKEMLLQVLVLYFVTNLARGIAPDGHRWIFGWTAFAASAVPFVAIRIGLATGKGPGILISHMVVSKMISDVRTARRNFAEVRRQQAFEEALHHQLLGDSEGETLTPKYTG